MMMNLLGLRLWIDICIGVGILTGLIYLVLSLWLRSRQKWMQNSVIMVEKLPLETGSQASYCPDECAFLQMESTGVKEEESGIRAYNLDKADRDYKGRWSVKSKQAAVAEAVRKKLANRGSVGLANGEAFKHDGKQCDGLSDKDVSNTGTTRLSDSYVLSVSQNSEMSWGCSYTQRELEEATCSFSDANVLGKGSQGLVYRGQLPDGTNIVMKRLSSNNRGQAEKDFKVEVQAVGRVRHKNLVRLIGYCMEGSQRVLVYEYIKNGNLKDWLHGPLQALPWDTRLKIIIGTAKGLAYLHEGLEPKVVHRDIKSSNILLDSDWNAKVSDFGFAKLLGAEHSHVTTRVMGTFGYVAPEYASTGMLTEKSDVFSYGVLVMELITGRVPVDYIRPAGEVHLVEWVKAMVGSRRTEEVADPRMLPKPSTRSLKRALLVALHCVDPDAQKRPKMGHVVHMLEEADSYTLGENGKAYLPRRNGDANMWTSIHKEHYLTKLPFALLAHKCNSLHHALKADKNDGQSQENIRSNGFLGIVDPKATWKYER